MTPNRQEMRSVARKNTLRRSTPWNGMIDIVLIPISVFGILSSFDIRPSDFVISSSSQKLRHRLRPGSHLQLLVNAPNISVHGFVADAELLGDLLVDQA